MRASRLQIKLYLADPDALEPRAVVPVFHRWIQESLVSDEVLVDVTDYSHVHQGPGVILIGHQAHYALDESEGRRGLVYTRRRETDGATDGDRLRRAFGAALRAARLLEADRSLEGRARFRLDEVLFRIQDRLLSPPTPETRAEVEPELHAFLVEVSGGAKVELEPAGGPREPFALRARIATQDDASTWLARLG